MAAAGQTRRSADVRRHTLATRVAESRTGEGEVELLYEVFNQDGEIAMTQSSLLLLKQRP